MSKLSAAYFRKIIVLTVILLGATVFAGAQIAKQKPTAQIGFTSVYTDMKRDCEFEDGPAETEAVGDPAGECNGFGGYKIFISYSAQAAHFRIESSQNDGEAIDLGTDYGSYGERGEKVEWRLANGKPFAVIIRINSYKGENDGGNTYYTLANRVGSKLVVKGLKGFERINFEIDGATPNANQKAREVADQKYLKK